MGAGAVRGMNANERSDRVGDFPREDRGLVTLIAPEPRHARRRAERSQDPLSPPLSLFVTLSATLLFSSASRVTYVQRIAALVSFGDCRLYRS